ncbi:hypothetical protein EUGRSUZ_F04180 [Eucalyptus grandis]|uniref:Uncharacterized protein n=2 Tax=Eucalyptus grandis TaxID=71139 RepID=A0ACC3KR90_EUCGR|nr:hypothetical protein EUGRSUZ_F04180 [Eucalyptus grandis]
MRNKYWNVTETSCNDGIGLNVTTLPSGMTSIVSCDCSFINSTVCHVTKIQLKGLDLIGIFPDEFGNLTYLRVMSALGNQISGIPKEIGNISTLEEFILEDNLLEGTLEPNIGNLSRLSKFELSSNNFTGTIPESFGNLKNLRTLRISDLKGSSSNFPNLQGMTMMQTLILRNCLLTGSIPSYIRNWTSMRTLDLSVNRLTGQVPDTMGHALDYMFLANNSLTGAVPGWVTSQGMNCSDLSYNNFNGSSPISCQESQVNLVSSYASNGNNSYYGLCMMKGNYKVRLHFAEIQYSNDKTFRSLGRRIFDVSIQGNQVLKDFNIAEEAGGVGKGIYRDFDNIYVNGSTLEIHLYWSGKGTTDVPDRGVYGPLISAIAVTPNFDVGSSGLSAGEIIGIRVALVVLLVLILLVLWLTGFFGGKEVKDPEICHSLIHRTNMMPNLRPQIKVATDNFDSVNKIGEGGFGPVYKGILLDGIIIAVKQHSPKSKQGNREFLNEIGMISALQHPNLIKLYGCCIEGNQLLLVYEYLENNSLARALFGLDEQQIELDWATRKKIVLGIARGLAYLHEESGLKIVHRDIKATNVLLDKELNAKISDFGLAKLNEEEDTHISTRVAGTIGYMAPEYAMRGYLTDKADVYSFGVVALEIVSGKSNTNYRPKDEFVYLLDWVKYSDFKFDENHAAKLLLDLKLSFSTFCGFVWRTSE